MLNWGDKPLCPGEKIFKKFWGKVLTNKGFWYIIKVQKRKGIDTMNTKFFKVVDAYTGENVKEFFALFVCKKETPIPTIEEIVERNEWDKSTLDSTVTEIPMEEFLRLHNELLCELADSANDMIEWSPNVGRLPTWEWWDSIEDYENYN